MNDEDSHCGSWLLAMQNRFEAAHLADMLASLDAALARFKRQDILDQRRKFEETGVFRKRPVHETAPPKMSALTAAIVEAKSQKKPDPKKRERITIRFAGYDN